ncbi:MAG: serine kinase [Actinobacteria bacterium]|nr:serine kinase [Actinomycetota bacterium]
MKLNKIASRLRLRELTPGVIRDEEVTGGFASDMLSDVLAHAPAGGVLITVQVHRGVVSVASLAGLQGIIFASARTPEQGVIDHAEAEGICLYSSLADTFEISGQLHEMGLRGETDCRAGTLPGVPGPHSGRRVLSQTILGPERCTASSFG